MKAGSRRTRHEDELRGGGEENFQIDHRIDWPLPDRSTHCIGTSDFFTQIWRGGEVNK